MEIQLGSHDLEPSASGVKPTEKKQPVVFSPPQHGHHGSVVPNISGKERFDWIEKNAYYYEDLKRFFSFHVEKGKRVLEIGYGVGPILEACKPAAGFGLDLSDRVAAESAKRYPQFKFAAWDGESSFPTELQDTLNEGVDYILLANAVGHWQDIQKALNLLKPLCQPHTRVIASYYNFLWAPVFRLGQYLGQKMPQPDCNWLSVDDVSNLFRVSGYREVKRGVRCLMPKKIPLLSNFANRYLSHIPGLSWLCCTHFVIVRPQFEMDPGKLKVSVIIPARNEAGNVEPAVRRMAQVATMRPEKYEVIFVEGNSKDNTFAEIERVVTDASIPKPFEISFHKQKGKGKGDAVRLGFEKATGDLLMILDADLTVPPEDLPKFVDVYSKGHGEFINGCRLVYKMEKEAMRPLNLLGNKFFSWAFTWLLDQRFKDTLCGTKVISSENYKRLARGRDYFGDFDPFGDFDLIFGASKLDLEIAEIPILYRERTYGETNISRWKHGWLLLKMCVYAMGRIKFVP